MLFLNEVQGNSGSCCSHGSFRDARLNDCCKTASHWSLSQQFSHSAFPRWLLHSRPLWKMLLSPSHVELFPNDKLKNGFTTVKFKRGLDRLRRATSDRCKCFNANLFPLNLSTLMVGWTLDLLSIWEGGMKIHGFGGNQGDYKSTKNPCGSTGHGPCATWTPLIFFKQRITAVP